MAPGSEPVFRASGHARPVPETHGSLGNKSPHFSRRKNSVAGNPSSGMRRISIHPTFLVHGSSEGAATGKQRTASWENLNISPCFRKYVEHRVCSLLHHVEISSKIQRVFVMGFERRCARSPVRRHALSYLNLLVAAAVILSCAWKVVTGLDANGGQAGDAPGDQPRGNAMLLFAEPLHSDGISFVTARLKAALSAGTPSSDMATIAAEAASLVSWSECSRFCNGGSQTADSERARKLAVEGLRLVFPSSDELSDSFLHEVENMVAQYTMDGDPAAGQAKTRPCNTFKCPFEVPTDLKTANLQIAQDPTLVASFGVLPQIEFTESCKERLMLDRIDQEIWTARRTEHLNYRRAQELGGEVPGWEATVFASEQLGLYSCVTLCRLHNSCSALIYTKDIVSAQGEERESSLGDPKRDALNVLESTMASANSAMNSLDDNFAKLSALDEDSVGVNSPSGSPVCTLYTGVKVSRVAECGVEPTRKPGEDTLTLLVINLDIDFGDVARVMRASMAQQLARMKDVLGSANILLNRSSTKNSKAANVQQRAEWQTTLVQKAGHHAQLASHFLPEAIRVMEEAAVDAAQALRASQFDGESAVQAAQLRVGKDDGSPQLTDGGRKNFYSATPSSASCLVFSGVELLNRGCVQLPALQTHSSMLTSTSSVDAAEAQHTSGVASSTAWQKCQGLLRDVSQHLDKYRTAVSHIKASGKDTEGAAREAKRLLQLILGLSAEETTKLSLHGISDTLQAETGLIDRDTAKLLDEKDALELRREVVERLGEETGTVLAVFDTAKQVCEIRAVFEPRHLDNGDTLGAQFPSACASFSPFSLMFLLSESSNAGSSSLETGASNSDLGTCEDISCTYSPWTSWSPCDDSHMLEADKTDESRNGTKFESDGAAQYRPAMWQVRVRETLSRPKVALQCDAVLEARLCKDRVNVGTEASGLLGGFTAAISKSISGFCIYSPYSEWSECSPKCLSGDTTGITAHQTRTRTVHQYPVPGLAPRCDTASLEMQKACGTVPNCSSGITEEHRVDSAYDRVEKGFDRPGYAASSAIHLHSLASVAGTEAPVSGRMLLSSLATGNYPGRSAPNGDPQNIMAEPRRVPVGKSETVPIEDVSESFMLKSDSADNVTSGEPTIQYLEKPAGAARTEDETVATVEGSTLAEDEGNARPDSDMPHLVADGTEDDDTLDTAVEGLTVVAPSTKVDETQNFTVEGNTAAESLTDDGSTQDPSVVAQPQGGQAKIPYDSPFIEDTVPRRPVREETGLSPVAEEKDHGSTVLGSPQDETLTIPYDSPLSGNKSDTSPGINNDGEQASQVAPVDAKPTGEGSTASTQTLEADSAATESFFLGLSCFNFVVCCLFGALASTVLVLITVVCSRRVRSWLGYDWSGGTEEERMTLLKKKAEESALPVAAPLGNPDGINVLRPDGTPLIVSPCLNPSGRQYVTTYGSQIFVTMEGEFVNTWGRPVQANELPKELLAKADAAQPKKAAQSGPLPGTIEVQGQVNGRPASIGPPTKVLGVPQQVASAQGKQMPFGAPPKNMGPVPKQVPEVRRTSAVPQVNVKKPGMPSSKAPGSG